MGSINSIYTSENRRSSPNGLGLNYSLDYKIDNKQNLGFIYDFGNQYYNMNAEGISRYERNLVVDSTLVTQQKQRWITPTHTLNIYYDLKLDSIGKN